MNKHSIVLPVILLLSICFTGCGKSNVPDMIRRNVYSINKDSKKFQLLKSNGNEIDYEFYEGFSKGKQLSVIDSNSIYIKDDLAKGSQAYEICKVGKDFMAWPFYDVDDIDEEPIKFRVIHVPKDYEIIQ